MKIDELFAKVRGTQPPATAIPGAAGEKPAKLPTAAPAKPNGGG